MISIQQFKALPLEERGALVFSEGKYLAVRSYYNFAINLYELYDFLVEVWYFPPTNKIKKIETLDNSKTLDLYIDFMNKTLK
jgi:hypothetical protein